MNEILEIKNVTKYYGKGSVVTKALDGISFPWRKGNLRQLWERRAPEKAPCST